VVTYRVLVVEDHELLRRYICSALRVTPQWRVIGEVSDGAEAVRQARALSPDLILLDVGLPTLSGIHAARQMIAERPGSRILFVSEHQTCSIAEEALATGARGYVIKSKMLSELLPAMNAVIDGRRFISAALAGRVVDPTTDGWATQEARRHEVGFYGDESALLDKYERCAEAALAAGNSLIVLVPGARREKLHQRLRAAGVDIDAAITDGRYVPVDVTSVSQYMVDGMPDEGRFWDAATSLILRAASVSKGSHPRVVACGECAPGLLAAGRTEAAIRLEQLWDEVTRTFDVDVFCGYGSDVYRCDSESDIFHRICAAHSTVRSL
jgi:DNA-binding NarL/FixJ family response regulator